MAQPAARKIIRDLEHPLRPWFQYPRRKDAAQTAADKREDEEQRRAASARQVHRQHISWWEDLRGELLRVEVPISLADSFADYLSGYVLVRDREQAKSDEERIEPVLSERVFVLPRSGKRSKGRVIPEWRRAKRTAKAWGLPRSPTTHPPQRQSLKTALSHLMVEALKSDAASLAKAADTVNSVWGLIGEPNDEFDLGLSVARAVRRARQRASPTCNPFLYFATKLSTTFVSPGLGGQR